MLRKELTVATAQGLHLRPASMLACKMQAFTATVTLRRGAREINAKSVLEIMGACIRQGTRITLICDGADEGAALAAASAFLQCKTDSGGGGSKEC